MRVTSKGNLQIIHKAAREVCDYPATKSRQVPSARLIPARIVVTRIFTLQRIGEERHREGSQEIPREAREFTRNRAYRSRLLERDPLDLVLCGDWNAGWPFPFKPSPCPRPFVATGKMGSGARLSFSGSSRLLCSPSFLSSDMELACCYPLGNVRQCLRAANHGNGAERYRSRNELTRTGETKRRRDPPAPPEPDIFVHGTRPS